MWVAPFGNLRINGYLLLPAAYRSLSRPSSAPDAKAFPLRSFQLDLFPQMLSHSRQFLSLNYCGNLSLHSTKIVCALALTLFNLRKNLLISLKRFPICCLFIFSSLYSVFNVLTGGDEQIRTVDPLLARQVLSHLSYTPAHAFACTDALTAFAPPSLSQGGGLKWTRTTDLALIRRAL